MKGTLSTFKKNLLLYLEQITPISSLQSKKKTTALKNACNVAVTMIRIGLGWMKQFAFHIALILLGKVYIHYALSSYA